MGYFAGVAALLFASAMRSAFLRRFKRVLTLSLPLQCPIDREQTRFVDGWQVLFSEEGF